MYIQLTTRCNMECQHCAIDCGPVGEDMPEDIFDKALVLGQIYDGTVTLGGGEPTIHPVFPMFLLKAIIKCSGRLCVTTNGKDEGPVRFLLKYAERRQVFARLSLDSFHDPINPDIVAAFKALPPMFKFREGDQHITPPPDTIANYSPIGRELRRRGLTETPANAHCVCPGPFIAPNGDIRQCGCTDHVVGHVVGHVDDVLGIVGTLPWPCSRRSPIRMITRPNFGSREIEETKSRWYTEGYATTDRKYRCHRNQRVAADRRA